MERNTRLANDLQILRCFWLSKLPLPEGVVPSIVEETLREKDRNITLLNDLATLLCTGEKGHSLAITMDKTEEGWRFTLATAAEPLESERQVVNNLFRLFQDKNTHMESLFNTAICTGVERVKKLIGDVKTHLKFFTEASFIREVDMWGDCKTEIPRLEWVQEQFEARESLSPADYLKRLFMALREDIHSLVGTITPENIKEGTTLTRVYRTCCLCDVLGRSRFFRRLTQLRRFDVCRHHSASLMSALLALGRYAGAAARTSNLIPTLEGTISYMWDTDIAVPPAFRVLDLQPTVYDALATGGFIEQSSGEEQEDDRAEVDYVLKLTSGLGNDTATVWNDLATVFLHPEVRLILLANATTERIVGASDDLCFCCKRWVEYHNESTERKWHVRPGLDMPDPTWMYPPEHPCNSKVGALVVEWTHRLVSFRIYGLSVRGRLLR
ncbi:hypothetical protein GLOTRDRAFT_129729 [Gloeophyllum trabeum ATCC 11539]|uniref:Uncharacterized protein n=1 Tax=Gloeophyllum trabeum (strain ATCC 11539 / FP-39264 / Madison 617) TaxID=670483 RepID=S7RM39_GLOTA|nr:uncharacterized protein GLOTRDRAFT_129729 [Gloeophyllum trabeum ATCC 11539]EPQ55455.1 hypothetical protein GLOTRDRAFT_129729 [Gloeophyllum trabeum ATCC 11539]